MRSPKEISVGNGWYWLAGTAIALFAMWTYQTVISPILPAIAWHRTHSRKMQFAEFSLDVPLLWSVPKADFQEPNDISIDKTALPTHFPIYIFPSSILLIKGRGNPQDAAGMELDSKDWMKPLPAWSDATRMTYPLASGSMNCFFREARNSLVMMWCRNESTGSILYFFGSRRDYLKLHDIVR